MSILRLFFRNVAISLVGTALFLATPPAAKAQNTVYAITVNGAFGTLNLSSGTFTQLGNSGITPAGMGGLGSNLFLGGDSGNTLYLVNTANGFLSPVGTGSISYNDFGATTGGLYAIGNDNNLYSINSGNGTSTVVGPLNIRLGASGLSSNGGSLYLVSDTGGGSVLYNVNTSIGGVTAIGNTGVSRIVSMVFANGVLYGANTSGNLYTLNASTGHATLVAPTGVDVYGMAAPAVPPSPLQLKPATPCRLIDTRQNGGPITGGTFRTFDLRSLAQSGACAGTGLDLSSASAYSLNVTLVTVNHAPVGYLTIWPTGGTRPVVSLMNSPDGRVKANAAIVPAGTGGMVNVYVTNTTNVLLDIDGYFDSASDNTALAFFPLTPCRVVNTRAANGPLGGPSLSGGVPRSFPIQQSPTCNIPSSAKAYSMNFTVVPQHTLGFLTVWPTGQSQPVVSTLNDTTGTVVANAAIVPAGNDQFGSIEAFATDNTDLLVDINGYFAPANSAPNPLSLFNLVPCRVLDTRRTFGLFNGTIPVGVVGSSCGIPAVALSFVFNATVVPPGSMGYLTLWPEGESQPVVSTLNAIDGAITSNMAIVPTNNGSIDAYAQNNTQLLLDISSYFAPIASVNVLTASLPDGTINQPYSVSLQADGGVPPYTWTLTSGSLPPGMNPLSPGGVISGTPTSNGVYNFTVRATDAQSNFASANLSITVNGSAGTLSISTMSLPNGTVNTPYNALLAANGGFTPYTWSIVSGSLPAGISLNSSTGLISGTPGAAGLSGFTVKVTDTQQNTAMQPLGIAINTGDANGTLNGQYAGTFAGYEHGNQLVAAFSFTADGNGNITGGETDRNNISSGVNHTQIVSGSYSIGSNGLGQINWTNSDNGTVQFLVATGAAEDMRIIYYNQNGPSGSWGSGVIRQQDPSAFNHATLAGNWALGIQGFDHAGNPKAGAGSFQQDSQGNLTNGDEVINDFGALNEYAFTGNAVGSIDSFGRLTSEIFLNGGTFHNAVYVVSANEKLFIGIDAGGSVQTGSNLRQSGPLNNGSLNGLSVGRTAKETGGGGNDVSVGLITTDGNGNVTLKIDDNKNGTVSQQTATGTYSSVASNGRTVFNLGAAGTDYGFLVGSNQAFVVLTGHGAGVFYFEPQSGGPFTNASFSGEFLGGTLPAGTSSVNTHIDSLATDGNGNFTLTEDESGSNGTNLNQMASFTYSVDSAGRVVVSQNGNTVGIAYIVSPTKAFVIDADPSDQDPWASVFVQSSAP